MQREDPHRRDAGEQVLASVLDRMATGTASRATAVRRWGAGTAAITRLLVAAEAPLTGVAIADAVGVSQPRASQVLKQLAEHDAVRATERRYVGHPARLLDLGGEDRIEAADRLRRAILEWAITATRRRLPRPC